MDASKPKGSKDTRSEPKNERPQPKNSDAIIVSDGRDRTDDVVIAWDIEDVGTQRIVKDGLEPRCISVVSARSRSESNEASVSLTANTPKHPV